LQKYKSVGYRQHFYVKNVGYGQRFYVKTVGYRQQFYPEQAKFLDFSNKKFGMDNYYCDQIAKISTWMKRRFSIL